MSIIDMISPKFYFAVDRNHLTVKQIGSTYSFETRTHVHIDTRTQMVVAIGESNISNPGVVIKDGFGHERVLIGDFDIADQVLKFVLRKVLKFPAFIRPVAVVHIKRKLAGGITQVEQRSVIDCFESAGARDVYIWMGDDFSERDFMDWATMKQTMKTRERQENLSKMKCQTDSNVRSRSESH